MTDDEMSPADRVREQLANPHPMDEGIASLESSSTRLANAVEDMSKRVTATQQMQIALEDTQNQMKAQLKTNRAQKRTNSVMAISIVFDIALSLAMAFGYFRIDHNSDRIGDIQHATNQAQCDMYGYFVSQIPGALEEYKDRPKKLKKIKAQAGYIQATYASLGCDPK